MKLLMLTPRPDTVGDRVLNHNDIGVTQFGECVALVIVKHQNVSLHTWTNKFSETLKINLVNPS